MGPEPGISGAPDIALAVQTEPAPAVRGAGSIGSGLAIPTADRLPALTLTPERQREKTQDAILNWLNARAG